MSAVGRARVAAGQVLELPGLELPGLELPDLDLPGGLPNIDPFSLLDADLPLLLLPVRIETRYAAEEDPPLLRIRIYPDQIHVDSDRPGASDGEAELTKQFWREWHTAKSTLGQRKAWSAHVSRVGKVRAPHLSRLLRPRLSQDSDLIFPTIAGVPDRAPAAPTLLPGKWLALGYSASGTVLFERESLPVAPDLRTAPDSAAPPWRVPASGLHVDEATAWMFDYERAVNVGMAITVPLTGPAAGALTEVATLLVVGVCDTDSPVDAAQELDRLLGAHARTDGLSFVPQGTPTNNTEAVVAGEPDATEPAAIEPPPEFDLPRPIIDRSDPFGPLSASSSSGRPRASAGLQRAIAADPGQGGIPQDPAWPDDILIPGTTPVAQDNAQRLAAALGLADAATLAVIPYATDMERDRSRAMVRVAFEAILGTFARRLLRVGTIDGVSPSTVDTLRDWCVSHVTGGGHYACLRVGTQPYGILPVRRSTSADSQPATPAEHVESIVSLLIGEWRQAVTSVPHLDPNRSADQETDIAAVLAAQPHPARFFVRRLDQYSDINVFQELLTPQWWYNTIILGGLDLELNPNLERPYWEIAITFALLSADRYLETIEEQIELWEDVREQTPGLLTDASQSVLDDAFGYIDAVLAILHGYQSRQNPLRSLDLERFKGVLGKQSTELIEGLLYSSSDEWGESGWVQAPDAPAGHTSADYLGDLRARFEDRGDTLDASTLDTDFLAQQPLLYQLLDRTLYLVPKDLAEEARVLAALDTLAATPADELAWLMRECLGLGNHRLDAWAASLAAERLSRMRQARPTGIQIGAFGWVTGLKPRDAEAEPAGFVHAPSMAHATTAALLRSGWLNHGSDDPLSPAAVNCTSSRVRAAAWLLDGVRQGQSLGDLLGYRFERALHDRFADDQIRPIREAVLVATGSPDVPPDEPVDGIALLDLYRAEGLGVVEQSVVEAIAEIEDAFDATNDTALVEAVHQLAAGNYERATATLGALTGTHSPPELRAPRTPRPGTSVEHRVLILLDPSTPHPGRGWVNGVRDTVAPALDAWVAGILPPAASVGFTVAPSDGGPQQSRTLASLGLSALDAIYLVGDDPAVTPLPLVTLASATSVDPARPGPAPIALTDFAVLAIELRRAIDSLRVADVRDLQPGHEAATESGLDDTRALDAVDALVNEFITLAAQAADTRRLALFGLATADPAILPTAAQRRLANVLAIEVDPADRRAGQRRRMAALVGGAIPLLGTFPCPITASPIATGSDVDSWLDGAAMVRADVARLTGAGLLSELLADADGLRAAAYQLPVFPGEPWAATHPLASGIGGRLSVVAIGAAAGAPAVVCGLVVDGWSERVPRTKQDTGLALQFDAPSNRPPQAWLLAVTPDGEPWNRQLVVDTLTETLEWATLRAVGTEDLLDFGRAIPTVFAPGNIVNWPTEQAVA